MLSSDPRLYALSDGPPYLSHLVVVGFSICLSSGGGFATDMGVGRRGFWRRWVVGFDDGGLWVLTTVEIGMDFDKIGVGVTTVDISVVEIGGWRDWCGEDRWVGRSVDWVLILL